MSIVHPVAVNPVVNPLVGILNMPAWRAGKLAPDGAIPDNAIYANGEPITDPSGTGYLTYGATT